MPEYTHPERGWKLVIREPISHRDVENWMAYYRTNETGSLPEEHGTVVRAAYHANWITEPEHFKVDDASPLQVRWMAQQIDSFYKELYDLDPE